MVYGTLVPGVVDNYYTTRRLPNDNGPMNGLVLSVLVVHICLVSSYNITLEA